MKKNMIIIFMFCSLVISAKTAEEYNKDAEAYSQKSKQGYIMAGVALLFVIAVKFLNKSSDKKD